MPLPLREGARFSLQTEYLIGETSRLEVLLIRRFAL